MWTRENYKKNYSDDWNRYDESVELECEQCKKVYHIEALSCGYGLDISHSYYLVKNGETIQKLHVYTRSFEERIVVEFYKADLKVALEVLQQEKYATRVMDSAAKSIIELHKKICSTVRLNVIVPKVKKAIENYEVYEWNKNKCDEEQKKRENVEKVGISFSGK